MQFEERIRGVIEEECEDYFLGFADLSIANEGIIKEYESLISIYPRAISIGITLPYNISDKKITNQSAVYTETNDQLSIITHNLRDLLENKGYKTLNLPKIGKDGIFISLHNLAANHADLGFIMEDVLVTPEVGSMVNWGTVLTDAPI
jgi:epoxyqueuosine reductase QueG